VKCANTGEKSLGPHFDHPAADDGMSQKRLQLPIAQQTLPSPITVRVVKSINQRSLSAESPEGAGQTGAHRTEEHYIPPQSCMAQNDLQSQQWNPSRAKSYNIGSLSD